MSSSDVIDDVRRAQSNALSLLGDVQSIEELREFEVRVLGKKGPLAGFKAQLGSLPEQDRKAVGQAINDALEAVSFARDRRRGQLADLALDDTIAVERMDLTEVTGKPTRGHPHLSTQAWERLEDVFIGLGFQVAEGPEIESDFYNFEALNMPRSHPARSGFDTMFTDYRDDGSVLLRTHTSPVQIRVMQTIEPPIYMVMPGKVFRRDTPDATHMPVFHQIEGLVIDRGITMAHLAGTIDAFTKAFFGGGFNSRLRPNYFPFTEPSAEFDIQRPDGAWIELGGCGMVHPNVLRAGGLDPEVWSGFAFGFGIDRMARERHGVDDLRDMFSNDVRFIEQF